MPIIDDHVVRVLRDPNRRPSPNNVLATLFWGDEVEDVETIGARSRLVLGPGRGGWTRSVVRVRSKPLLKAAFIDVGQGDGCLLESPSGKTLLVDGGEHQRLARYLARRYGSSTGDRTPVVFDAVVVTHGDADHFEGLSILATQASEERRDNKCIHFATARLFHNGLVKRPQTTKGRRRRVTEMFGSSQQHSGVHYAVDLVDDLLDLPTHQMNRPFKSWAAAIRRMRARHPLESRRIERGDDQQFAFFDPDVRIEVLGPQTVQLPGGRRGLPFLSAPGGAGASAAHTINGHSIVLRITHGFVRILLAADLNSAAEGELLNEARRGHVELTAEVLKVPHHGSGDFAVEFFRAVRPIVSIVSAGDEDGRHEYIHPRANLMGALGKAGRTNEPIVMVTDLAAFDRYAGPAIPARRRRDGTHVPISNAKAFYARERIAHGVVHVRTDGKKLFVGTWSGRRDRTEHYLFSVGRKGRVRRLAVDRV